MMTAPTRPGPELTKDLTTCYAQVLVPVDFSTLSWKCLSAATALARGFGVPHRVLHVDTSSPWLDLPPHKLTLHAAPKGQRVSVEVLAARTAAEGIVQVLGDDESSLLVMSSHGHTAAAEIAVGSTAEEVLRRWHGPVVVTGPRYRGTRPVVTRIVVAIPPLGSLSVALANDVRAWADRFGVPVQVVTVIDEAAIGYDFEQHREQLIHLSSLAASIGAEPVPLHGPRTAHELVAYADMQPGTLLAMAPRVKPVAAQLIFGSVSKAVLRHTTNPILFRHA
jgi:nucleotide-binding universal stress UspA family protein